MESAFHIIIIALSLAILLFLLFGTVKCKSSNNVSMKRAQATAKHLPTFINTQFGGCALGAADANDLGSCCSSSPPTDEDCQLAFCMLDGNTSMFSQCQQCNYGQGFTCPEVKSKRH